MINQFTNTEPKRMWKSNVQYSNKLKVPGCMLYKFFNTRKVFSLPKLYWGSQVFSLKNTWVSFPGAHFLDALKKRLVSSSIVGRIFGWHLLFRAPILPHNTTGDDFSTRHSIKFVNTNCSYKKYFIIVLVVVFHNPFSP